jgi:hypothetical protein
MLTCVGLTNIGENQFAPGSRRSTARGRSSRSRGPPRGAAEAEAAIRSVSAEDYALEALTNSAVP